MGNELNARPVDRSIVINGFPARDKETRYSISSKTREVSE
jgi:hypothetical protein